MENNWEPRVGQKVVSLKTAENLTGMKIVKDKTYEVERVCVCPLCNEVNVSLKELFDPTPGFSSCVVCVYQITPIRPYVPSSWLAPVAEQYADMTSEIAQQFKEHPDTVDQPVKVLETSN